MHAVRNMLVLIVSLLPWLACIAPADAQTVEQQGYRAVDQLRDDVDPLSRSLRHTDTGLAITGERQNVYRSAGDPSKRLYYISQGVLAEFDRSDYAMTQNGQVLQLGPPNLVYHITPPKGASAPPPDAPSDRMVNGRVEGRMDGEVALTVPTDGRVVFRIAEAEDLAAAQIGGRPGSAWDSYRQVRSTMRMMVVGALGRQQHDASPQHSAN